MSFIFTLEVQESNKEWSLLGGGFKHFLFSPRSLGKISILTHIFRMGWFNHQLVFNLTNILQMGASTGN